ncbi:unnamed protein product [Phytomonas sp. Hart1]|nr:unnamed protein product [Phytomonas sp. Hart1]|eukprot:CCW67348.1 unnamed protein product [Phytomonas sp. isolate Hart1]
MVVALGRSIQSPLYTFFQIVNAVSLFFVILGGTRFLICLLTLDEELCPSVLVGKNGNIDKQISPTSPLTKGMCLEAVNAKPVCVLSSGFYKVCATCSHILPSSLFKDSFIPRRSPSRHSESLQIETSFFEFILMHMLTSVLVAYPLSILLERGKLVFDFMLTIYGVYFLFTDITLHHVMGGGLYWWFAVSCGMTVLYSCTWWICRRRELQVIPVSQINVEMIMIPPSDGTSSQECFRGGEGLNYCKDKFNNVTQTADLFTAHNENNSIGETVALPISDSRCKDE